MFVYESLCPYYKGLENKWRAIKNSNKLYQFYTKNGIIQIKLIEHGQVQTIKHLSNLEQLFPVIDINHIVLFFCLHTISKFQLFVVLLLFLTTLLGFLSTQYHRIFTTRYYFLITFGYTYLFFFFVFFFF